MVWRSEERVSGPRGTRLFPPERLWRRAVEKTVVGGGAPFSRELPAFITHLAFGIIFTGAYKGLVKRRVDQVS